MTDDITQRLRAAVPKMPDSGTPIAWPCKVRSELLLEAAAEIETLRAENKRLHQAHQAACEGGDLLRAVLRAEIDGLEAELALMKSGFEIAYRAMGDKP